MPRHRNQLLSGPSSQRQEALQSLECPKSGCEVGSWRIWKKGILVGDCHYYRNWLSTTNCINEIKYHTVLAQDRVFNRVLRMLEGEAGSES